MIRWFFDFLLLSVVALLVGAVLYLTLSPSHGQDPFLQNDTATPLNQAQLLASAAPLQDSGANVALFYVPSGEDSTLALEAAGFKEPTKRLDDNAIAIYVSVDPRYSEIRWGRRWNPYLEGEAETIRQEVLNPALQAGDPTAAFDATLNQLTDTLSVSPVTAFFYDIRQYGLLLAAAVFLTLFVFINPLIPKSKGPVRGGGGGGGGGGSGGGSAGGGY